MDYSKRFKECLANKNFDVKYTCRACLITDPSVRSVFAMESTTAEELLECTDVEVWMDDGLPRGLCPDCRDDLNTAHAFKNRCQQSDELLKTILADKSSEPSDPLNVAVKPNISQSASNASELIDETLVKIECDPDHNSDSSAESIPSIETKPMLKRRKVWQCDICRRHFRASPALASHKKHMHKNDAKSSVPTFFKCDECPYTTTLSHNLDRHLKIHSKNKRLNIRIIKLNANKVAFKCQKCPYISERKDKILVHLNEHSHKTPSHVTQKVGIFQCKYCSYVTSRLDFFTAHITTHSKTTINKHKVRPAFVKPPNSPVIKNLKCNLCPFVTNRQYYLERHLEKHEEGPCKCKMCIIPFQ